MKKQDRELKFMIASNQLDAAIAAGYSLSDAIAAGYSLSVLRLCVRLRSVGIERSGSLHKTAVISWLRLIKRKAKYEALKKRIKKKKGWK